MQLIESPNRWSCLPASFAMAMGLSLDVILESIGHDGSEIIWPLMPEPQRRRTFHLQECIAVSWRFGWAVTEHEFEPILTPDGMQMLYLLARTDIKDIMRRVSGVLIGRGRANMHAVAWDTEHIYDPQGVVYGFQNQAAFTPQRFMAFTKIKSDPA